VRRGDGRKRVRRGWSDIVELLLVIQTTNRQAETETDGQMYMHKTPCQKHRLTYKITGEGGGRMSRSKPPVFLPRLMLLCLFSSIAALVVELAAAATAALVVRLAALILHHDGRDGRLQLTG
jgi:hypothetical protein